MNADDAARALVARHTERALTRWVRNAAVAIMAGGCMFGATTAAHAQAPAAPAIRAALDTAMAGDAEQLLADAEAAYREQRDREAFAKYVNALALLPRDAHAWLRIGNLWQRNGEPWRAVEAYRRAVEAAALWRERPDEQRGNAEATMQAATKAATNLAILGMEQAQLAMQSVDRARLPAEMQPAVESIERSLRAPGAQAREPVRPVLR